MSDTLEHQDKSRNSHGENSPQLSKINNTQKNFFESSLRGSKDNTM